MYDASDRKDVRRAEKASKLAAREDAEVIQAILSTSSGRSWMHRQLEALNIFHTPYVPDSNATLFNCGMQSVGLRLLAEIMRYCPDKYMIMEQEANVRRTAAERSEQQKSERRDSGAEDFDDAGAEAGDTDSGADSRS